MTSSPFRTSYFAPDHEVQLVPAVTFVLTKFRTVERQRLYSGETHIVFADTSRHVGIWGGKNVL